MHSFCGVPISRCELGITNELFRTIPAKYLGDQHFPRTSTRSRVHIATYRHRDTQRPVVEVGRPLIMNTLVVGGYGAVGYVLVRVLATVSDGPNRVYIAG